MDSDAEDVERMTQFIESQKKSNYQSNFQLEFQDFITFNQDTEDLEFDDELLPQNKDLPDEEPDSKDFETLESTEDVSVTALTEDERAIIDSCTDPELKRLLILNRLKNMQMMKFQKKLQTLILECEESLTEKEDFFKNISDRQLNRQGAYVWKLAAPYFKDKKFYPCPPNQDTIKKQSNKELAVYDIVPSPKWSTIEIDRLINAVRCNYNINRQNDIVQRMTNLKASTSESEDSKPAKIAELDEELQIVKSDNKTPPLNSNEFINWYKISDTFLRNKHTPNECQSVWHLLVHPDINKSEWTESENKNLETIAKVHKFQNWDAIASQLNTNRTAFTACLHFFSKLCDKFKKSKFTAIEDSRLLEVIDGYRQGNYIPWHKVVQHFHSRSRHQLYHRYIYYLSQSHVKRGKFSEAEDVLLIILVNRFGRNYKKCAEYMPHRSQVQLKSRYISNLQRDIKKGTFTEVDDQTILEHVRKNGEKNWSGLTERLNRCSAQIRQRYRLIKNFLEANPDAELGDIPKRKHNFDKSNEDRYSFLNFMAEQYRNADYIPTLAKIEESLQIESEKPASSRKRCSVEDGKNIDTMLTDFFVASSHSGRNRVNVAEAANNVEQMLAVLRANLQIPGVFECNIHLDNVDVEILERLAGKNLQVSQGQVESLVAPNLNTLVGLRSLIIKHKDYKAQQRSRNLPSCSKNDEIPWAMEQNLIKTSEAVRKEILSHRDLFSRRFDSLFNWSAVLSLEKPVFADGSGEKSATPIRTYVRKSLDGPSAKKRKIDVSSLNELRQQANKNQLKVLDKSVVEKLMQSKKNVSIIQIKTVTDSEGVVRQMLGNSGAKEVGTKLEKASESRVDEDVDKMSSALVAGDSRACCSSEEYQAIQGDVQLLKEILQYEKIKMEPDI